MLIIKIFGILTQKTVLPSFFWSCLEDRDESGR